MRAIRYDRYGPPEVLRSVHVPEPVAERGQVVVRVRAAGVHPVELHVRAGKLRRVLREPLPRGLGGDFTGVIEAVGDGVDPGRAGEEVWGVLPHLRVGSTAERVAVPAHLVTPAPTTIGLTEAAALPAAGTTVLRALTEKVTIGAGTALLVRGAAGGVGVLAVQLGRALGAHVTALARAEHLGLVTALGADLALDYRTTEPAGLGPFDVVLDLVGSGIGAYRRSLKPGGRLIALALDPDRLVRSVVSTLRPGIVTFTNDPGTAELDALARAVDDGLLRPVVADVLPMAAASRAHHRLAQGGVAGRIVLDPRADLTPPGAEA
ncbi:NAD(P)-dependent alcohol dehydrogenase [Catenuloplanes sp. NPDC051500]|uniref:NAD(P)-dependent alcohol dehydrogenase n=1 Tax=Catenuloplanes sp. NPDC051500 TaxID=3363959 RepID=UPI00378F322F